MYPKDFALIAPQSIWAYDPESFREYVRSLRDAWVAHEEKKKLKRAQNKPTKASISPIIGVTFRLNTKGTPVITFKRKPKYLLKSEIIIIAKSLGLPQNQLWVLMHKRKVPILNSSPEAL